MPNSLANFFKTARIQPSKSHSQKQVLPIRMSGTTTQQLSEVDTGPNDGPIDSDNPVGRMGNDWLYPDVPRGLFLIGTVNGNRLQDFANSHLSEGPAPGRIPHGWNTRTNGKLGRDISGNPSGDVAPPITITGDASGGIGDMKYIPHTPIPRTQVVSRPYLRTIDDSAFVPGVYVADATRR